jgi:hypothetical protein
MTNFRILKSSGEFRSWRPFLETWHELNERCINHTDGLYAPFCYRERTSVGVLSASAVRHDWVALEEYQTKKNVLGERLQYNGRADLFLIHKTRTKKVLFEVEAKLIRKNVGIECGEQHKKILLRAQKAAEQSCPNNDHDYVEHKVALAFIVPFIVSSKKATTHNFEKFEQNTNLRALIQEISNTEPELLAYSFVDKGCELLVGETQKPKYGFGIIMVANIVKTYSRC